MKRTSTLLIIGIIAVLLVGLYTGYLFWEKSDSETELKQVAVNLIEQQNKLLQFENKEVLQAINAKKTLEELDRDIIQWSKIIKEIRKTIPKEDGVSIVEILSYSGSSNNEISMSVKTYPQSHKPYFQVAELIETFDESTSFADNFVPSISTGTDEEGSEILTFLFGTRYVEENPLDLLENETGEESEAIVR
jgi:Tfp pilus assembly protein PilN